MGIVFLKNLRINLRGFWNSKYMNQYAANVILLMASVLIQISMDLIYIMRSIHIHCFFTFTRSHLMASAGNNGTVQLWQDHKRLNNGYC
jgi:hypothetical protein